MNSNSNSHRTFHPIISKAYTAVHQWLENNVPEAQEYKQLTYNNLKRKLQETDWKHIAFQFYALFPTHYFKAAHSLESIIGTDTLISWLRHEQQICVLDIGCGAGTGSAAFLEVVLYLKESGKLTNDINLFFIGVDPSHRAIGLYHKMMEHLKSSTNGQINLEYKSVNKGFPNASTQIRQFLKDKCTSSQLPCLTNVLVMQLNVISPFSQNYRNEQANIDELKSLGINIDESVEGNDIQLGTTEAQSYRQLIEDVPVDIMHILTVGTKNMENQVQIGTDSEIPLSQRIQEMSSTFEQIIGKRHRIEQISSNTHTVYFTNPFNCYWREIKKVENYNNEFYADFQTIRSADLEKDSHWNDVISLDNLRLAWARAHHNLLKETLCDETEIRLFEMNLEARLYILIEKLCAYARDVALTDQNISYKVPKNINDSRPKGLSRIEEEILSVAIIQQLGDKASQLRGNSYAYKIAGDYRGRQTEYFYGYWFDAYRAYMTQAKDSAKKYPNCDILRVDIESFYTKIIQSQLCDELCHELTESERIRWLIRLLLSKNIDEHEVGKGITQGSISSGFYANIYLTAIDTRFGPNREPKAELHRYVDDMIFIVPDPEDVDLVEKFLVEELNKLGLKLNQKKTEKLTPQEFLQQAEDEDQCLEKLSKDFECIVNYLYILNPEHRSLLENSYDDDERWWDNIERYQQCLQGIKIYIHPTELSRRIYRYLFNQRTREKDLKKQLEVLKLEGEIKKSKPPEDNCLIRKWSDNFYSLNNIWSEERENLRSKLTELFLDSWQKLCDSRDTKPSEQRKLQKYIRFTIYRLSVLGLEDIIEPLMNILQEQFWIIRDSIHLLENLARQGYYAEIRTLLTYYQNHKVSSEYLKAITLRAMRFLPKIDVREWEIIVEFSTLESSSIVEKLMATETWLYLGHKYSAFKQDSHLQSVQKALKSDQSHPNQLVKNYILILGLFDTNIVQDCTEDVNDPMLKDARDLALKGNPSDIFDFPELNILRRKYYSGQPQSDNQEGSP